MILTDREIAIALDCKQIIIDPRPGPDSLSSTSVDLTLANEGLEWQPRAGMPIRPGEAGYAYTSTTTLQKNVSLSGYSIRTGSFLLAWTRERVELPTTSRLAARVEGKSSLARLGLGVHITAPTIHAGFKGQIQLEMFNFGPHEIILDAEMRICQLIFELTMGTPQAGYQGMFSDQASTGT